MTHAPIFNGGGYHCSRCNQSWDQGDPQPGDCVGAGVQPLGPLPTSRPAWIGAQLSDLSTALKVGHGEIAAVRKDTVDTP